MTDHNNDDFEPNEGELIDGTEDEDQLYAVKIVLKSGAKLVLKGLRVWQLRYDKTEDAYSFSYEFDEDTSSWLNFLDPSDVTAVVVYRQDDPDLTFSELEQF